LTSRQSNIQSNIQNSLHGTGAMLWESLLLELSSLGIVVLLRLQQQVSTAKFITLELLKFTDVCGVTTGKEQCHCSYGSSNG
jgi:hypothetical protein